MSRADLSSASYPQVNQIGKAAAKEKQHDMSTDQDKTINNIRSKPPHIYDNICRKLLRLGITLATSTFIGLIIRYALQEFDPSVSTISVTTSKINDRHVAQLNVSQHFLQRLLDFIEEALSLVVIVLPLGFPICTLFNRYFARLRANPQHRLEIQDSRVLSLIPKYVIIGDSAACLQPDSGRLRPLIRDTIYHLIRAHLKPKLLVEDSYDEARKLGLRIGLIGRQHHRLAVIKSVDLVRLITDSRGDIKEAKVRYLLSKLKIMSQSTPADKSFLVYLIKHCESLPNENVAYLGHSFTDPEAMRMADCAISYADCDDDEVKQEAQVLLKSESQTFTDLYLFVIICLLYSNVTQSYALYQISAAVSSCLYRFLSITVFQEQLVSHSQFTLLLLIQQVLAIFALMTKWLASLPQAPLKNNSVAEMSHSVTEDHHHHQAASLASRRKSHANQQQHHKSTSNLDSSRSLTASESLGRSSRQYKSSTNIRMQALNSNGALTEHSEDDSSHSIESADSTSRGSQLSELDQADRSSSGYRSHRQRKHSHAKDQFANQEQQMVHLSGIDLDEALINSRLVTSFRQSFRNSTHLLDDVTYRLTKLHIAYQLLVMIIIMIFGNSMFQLSTSNSRQQQTLALNSLMMNNLFNLTNCFNQVGKFNLRAGVKSNPFFLCVLLIAAFIQVSLTELNAFGLENLNPIQWFVCFVFALLSSLIAPITGQQQPISRRAKQRFPSRPHQLHHPKHNNQHHEAHNRRPTTPKSMGTSSSASSKRHKKRKNRRQVSDGSGSAEE